MFLYKVTQTPLSHDGDVNNCRTDRRQPGLMADLREGSSGEKNNNTNTGLDTRREWLWESSGRGAWIPLRPVPVGGREQTPARSCLQTSARRLVNANGADELVSARSLSVPPVIVKVNVCTSVEHLLLTVHV